MFLVPLALNTSSQVTESDVCSAPTRPGEKFKNQTRKRGREDSDQAEKPTEETIEGDAAEGEAPARGRRVLRGCAGRIESMKGDVSAGGGGGALTLNLKAPREAAHLVK